MTEDSNKNLLQNDGSAIVNQIKVGDMVRGALLNSKETVEGKVLQINHQNGEIVSFKVLSRDGEEVLLDPTTTDKYNEHGEEPDAGSSIEVSNTGPRFEESHQVLSYGKWLFEKNNTAGR